nr:retrovirus-related Pol polyprotein from transposon TNT 1-94 [Tanacetum cinerariifolium]
MLKVVRVNQKSKRITRLKYKKMKAKLALLEASPPTSQSLKPLQSKNKGLVAKTFNWDEDKILKSKAKPYLPCTHCGFNNHRPDDCRNYHECEICRSYNHFTSGYNHVIQVRGGVIAESSQSSESSIGEDNLSRQYQANYEFSYCIIPHGRSLTELTQENHVPEVTAPNGQDNPHTEDIVGMLTKSMAAKLTTASASECLFAEFLLKIEPTKEEGIEYDKTFALVARMEAIVIFLAFSTYMNFIVFQMDVKSSFLNRILKEEVYVKQPSGFESSEFPDYVYKLDKALYELKQAPRACLGYNQGAYVSHPSPEAVKDELAKFATNEVLVNRTPVLKMVFLMAWRILFTLVIQDEKFRSLPSILSNSNFTKDPSEVIEIELTALMIVVNNLETLVSPFLFSGKKKKRKSQNVSKPKPKTQGSEASGSLPQEKKKPLTKKTTPQATETPPTEKVLTEDSDKIQLASSGQTAHPQDTERNIQLVVKGFHSSLGEGTCKSQLFPKGADVEDQTQYIKFEVSVPDQNKDKTSSKVEPNTQTMLLTTAADVQVLVLSDDELIKESNDDVFEAGDEMDKDI